MDYSVRNPESITTLGLASFPFARRYLGNRFFFLFLRLLRCFSSAGLPPPYYFIHMAVIGHEPNCVSTFGNLRVKRIFAPNRSLSQLIASFIGTWCQGIRPVLLLAWPLSSCVCICTRFGCWIFTPLLHQNPRICVSMCCVFASYRRKNCNIEIFDQNLSDFGAFRYKRKCLSNYLSLSCSLN